MLRYSFNKSRCPRYKMSKIFLITLVVAMCMEHILAAPAPEEYKGSIIRQKRVTCDLLSFEAKGVAANHSICAAHCLVIGRKGGSCQNGVCVCRN
ncbi:Arthropod defensin [Popillia japonica]|uniref:Arthropod defensin n=1 Tax=Popillia japonica TaxID=7064 RepID=A0AAW1L7Q0_POPJA